MKKTELNSIYGVMAGKYTDTDINSIYPDNGFMVSIDTICDKLVGKIHAAITYYLSLLDNHAEFAIKYAIKEDRKEDSCFHYTALDTHTCYDEVIRTIFEISNLLIPFDVRYGTAYNHFMVELNKAKEIGHKMFNSIDTIADYKKFAQDVRRGLLE